MLLNLSEIYIQLCLKSTSNKELILESWEEIDHLYSGENRCYHNLNHLENMIHELEIVKREINDYDSLLFSIFYHDIIYKSSSKENESQSAKIASDRLQNLSVNNDRIKKIHDQILATATHQFSTDSDTNYLLDADLSILGKTWTEYQVYIQQIRKEYSIYPDFLYKPGRKKVLEHFLSYDTIYKTTAFYDKYESQARQNIAMEIELL